MYLWEWNVAWPQFFLQRKELSPANCSNCLTGSVLKHSGEHSIRLSQQFQHTTYVTMPTTLSTGYRRRLYLWYGEPIHEWAFVSAKTLWVIIKLHCKLWILHVWVSFIGRWNEPTQFATTGRYVVAHFETSWTAVFKTCLGGQLWSPFAYHMCSVIQEYSSKMIEGDSQLTVIQLANVGAKVWSHVYDSKVIEPSSFLTHTC